MKIIDPVPGSIYAIALVPKVIQNKRIEKYFNYHDLVNLFRLFPLLIWPTIQV